MSESYRSNRLAWDDMWMLFALTTAQRSPDGNTQVGAIIVSPENKLIASGYNGAPKRIHPVCLPWNRSGESDLDTKYPYVVHAEVNAIHNSTTSTKDGVLYTTLFPCNECMKSIIQSEIKKVYYLEDKYAKTWQNQASRRLAGLADVECIKHKWNNNIEDMLNLINLNITN